MSGVSFVFKKIIVGWNNCRIFGYWVMSSLSEPCTSYSDLFNSLWQDIHLTGHTQTFSLLCCCGQLNNLGNENSGLKFNNTWKFFNRKYKDEKIYINQPQQQ